MRVLMLGWEFPPFISGGLGTACRGLTDAMRRLEARILFVLPRSIESHDQLDTSEAVDTHEDTLRKTDKTGASAQPAQLLEVTPVQSEITNPYRTANPQPASTTASTPDKRERTQARSTRPASSSVRVVGVGAEDGYDGDLMGKIHAYADRCAHLTRRELFDIIHAHDWMTFPAAVEIARISGRPLVVHVHATEFDRSGEHINRSVFEIERYGMHAATAVIAVSQRTKNMIVQRYGVPPGKVHVVHNGIEMDPVEVPSRRNGRRERVVLFLGRITMQKGPEYFVRAAARVAERLPDVRFVVAGTGDQLPYVVALARELGLNDRIEFTGFLRGPEVDEAYRRADVFAMPSVSEPFGLTALEAAKHGVPVILSTSSGAAEVLKRGSMKVDYWDVEMMSKMIVSVLNYPLLAQSLRRASAAEIAGLTWDVAARKCIGYYYDALKSGDNGSRWAEVEKKAEQPLVAL
jgi:glycogen(starch) synthase